jgi:type IV pilus assembly protein PilQ
MRAFALFTALASAGLLTNMPGFAAGAAAGAPGATVRLTNITTRVHANGASLVIEATEPVPYLTSRPDPLTVLVDLRNVGVVSHADLSNLTGALKSVAGSPIAHVMVETAESSMGSPISRVRVALSEPFVHHVRSDRNTIVVDFEKPSTRQAPFVLPPASRAAPDAMLALATSTQASPPSVTPVIAHPADLVPVAAVRSAVAPNVPTTAAFQAVPAVQVAAPSQALGNQRVYTGHPVSLDFQGADLRAVLRTFAEISGLNMVIDPAVQGSVDVALREVPWDQALDLILRANKLGYSVDGTIVRITPLTVLADEESQRRKLAEEQALAGDLRVLTRTLSYAKANDLQALITRSALSQRGTVQVDIRTNTLIITDLQERLNTASDLLNTLDRAEPQVEIEARVVQTNKSYARELGVEWGFGGRVDPALGNTTNLAFPNNGSLGGRVGSVQGPTGQPTAVSLGASAPSSAVGLALGSVNGAFNLDVALSALEESGNGRILSSPRVSTLNNVEAEMTQGVQIPIQTQSNNTTTVTFKDAALSLRVQPQITASGTVIMKVTLENSSADFGNAVNGIPPIDTQRAITTVLVKDGETTVIGGIYTSEQQSTQDRTPGLSQVPLLGWLFKRDAVRDANRELLIFITPRIIKG